MKDTKKEQPSVEQVLSHLDHMRQVCRNISCKYIFSYHVLSIAIMADF